MFTALPAACIPDVVDIKKQAVKMARTSMFGLRSNNVRSDESTFWNQVRASMNWRANWPNTSLEKMTEKAAKGFHRHLPGKTAVPWIPSSVDDPGPEIPEILDNMALLCPGEEGQENIQLTMQYLNVCRYFDNEGMDADAACSATMYEEGRRNILMAVFENEHPFKGAKGKGKGKTSPSPDRTMLGSAVGRDQTRVYKRNVLIASAARQVVAEAAASAKTSSSPPAAPAVASASSSGPAVAADPGGAKGYGKGSSGPSGATGSSDPSGAAKGPPKGAPGRDNIDWPAHFAQETQGPPKGAKTPATKGKGEWIDYPH
jgi:hypothetical protein